MEYLPQLPPSDVSMLPSFLMAELQKIQQSMNAQQMVLRLAELNVAPVKPRNGDVVYADGTNWNPGGGRGVYVYKVNAWVLLG